MTTVSTRSDRIRGDIPQSERAPSPDTERVRADELEPGDWIAGGGWSQLRIVLLVGNWVWLQRHPDAHYQHPTLYRIPRDRWFVRKR